MRDLRPFLALLLVLSLGGCDRAREWWGGSEDTEAAEPEPEPAEPVESEAERQLRIEREKAELARLEAERLERERLEAEEAKRKLEEADAMVERWAEELEGRKAERNMFEEHQGLTEDDPWGKQIRVRYEGDAEGDEHGLEVRSAGPDGTFGTSDDLVRTRTTTIEHSWWEKHGRVTTIILLWLGFGLVASLGHVTRRHRRRDDEVQGIDMLDVLVFIGSIVFAPLAILAWIVLGILAVSIAE